MKVDLNWWAVFLTAVAGVVLAGGLLAGRLTRPVAVVSLVLFLVAAVLLLVTLAVVA